MGYLFDATCVLWRTGRFTFTGNLQITFKVVTASTTFQWILLSKLNVMFANQRVSATISNT